MDFDCKTQTLPAQPVLTVRTHTPVEGLQQVLGQAYMRIFEHLQELGQQPAGAPFVAYYNMDMQNLDLEIGFPVATLLPARDEVLSREIPEFKAATCLYLGPYPGMAAAYDARRVLRRIGTFSQSPDHPVIPMIPETEYLKGLAYELVR